MRVAPFKVFPFAFFIFRCSFSQSLLDPLAIEVRGSSREFAYTNKHSAYFYGESNSHNRSGWQGFNVYGKKFVDDYELYVGGTPLDRAAATAFVYPDYLKRVYPSGIIEELRLADSVAVVSVALTLPKPTSVSLRLFFSDVKEAAQCAVRRTTDMIMLARGNHLQRTAKENYPVWLAVGGERCKPTIKPTKLRGKFSPFLLSSRNSASHLFVFAVGDEVTESEQNIRNYRRNKTRYDSSRRARMELLLQQTFVETDNLRFNKALAWAKLSLDALMMNQGAKGIFAGLPWFNDYWGRDTFIALPGATLVLGRFSEAKEILRAFAVLQQTDSGSTDYGRIPNRVTTTDIGYNTADGTPRFGMMASEYVERSGDTAFVREIYPTIFRSIEGTLKYHADSLGFLTHGDQETWMDAAGPNGCWSPRGNRANDIQALWGQQLRAGIGFAVRLADSTSARRWNEQLLQLEKNFALHFFSQGQFVDHLNADGSRDAQLRPNQIFLAPLLNEGQRARILRTVVNELTYEYGVASLAQTEKSFHPYHQHEPFYPKDAAYHNGTVWTWLQGPVISELCAFSKQDFAWKLTQNAVHEILDRGAVGTQSELLDAIARPGEAEPRASGTFSQAWNLAEFIRNFYDDYLGIRVSLLSHRLVLRPMLPTHMRWLKATVNLGGRALPIEIQRSGDSLTIHIDGKNLRKGGTADVALPATSGKRIAANFFLAPQSYTIVTMQDSRLTLYSNGVRRENISATEQLIFQSFELDSLKFVTPKLDPNLRSLAKPEYELLTNEQIKVVNPSARRIISASDPVGDDVGAGAYRYPLNSNFVQGCLDLTRFNVSIDQDNAYFHLRFRALSNPGWHPEYGFQLTYAAIAIDEDGIWNSGSIFVGKNANYPIEKLHAYEKLICIGGGIRLEDRDGKILCAYIPTANDVSNPLGDAEARTISFAVPLRLLGTPSRKWTWTVLVGAQDDHGGAGIGEFRTVGAEAGEWIGGGKMSPHEPNVYDVLIATERK